MIRVDIEKKLKAYNGIHTLRITRDLAPGSITVIHGPSGAGKTTFLKMLAGLITPDSGKIMVNDKIWFDSAARIDITPQQRRPGFVFQDNALFPNMTVAQQLRYVASDEAWIARLLDLGELADFKEHRPEHLSGGQQQRVAILRALAIRPSVLLMDEPFSALDAKTKARLIVSLQEVIKELQATVLIVTHDRKELQGVADDDLLIGDDQLT